MGVLVRMPVRAIQAFWPLLSAGLTPGEPYFIETRLFGRPLFQGGVTGFSDPMNSARLELIEPWRAPVLRSVLTPDEDGTILRQTYTGGQERTEVMVSTIRGGRHVWPHRELSATELIWEFFARHSRNTTPRQAIRRGVTPTKEATAS